MTQIADPNKLVLVTGPAGAGRSTAIRALEDLGFEAIDNMPLRLVPRLLDGSGPEKPMALGIDARNRDFSTFGLIEMIDRLGDHARADLQVLYLDCSPEVLIRRFSETRRRHPLAPEESPDLGLERELDLLLPVKARADMLVDTSEMSPNDLRSDLERWFAPQDSTSLAVTVHSFSYKRGLPRGMDMALDCRFLRNPHWEEHLRVLTGRDCPVQDYVAQDARFAPFHAKTTELLDILLPAYAAAGKPYICIGFGCTGGQHRSVVMAETFGKTLAEKGWLVSIRHRELERVSPGLADLKPSPNGGPAKAGESPD